MVNFLATRIIQGKLTWRDLKDSASYAKYCDAVLDALEIRGYKIDNDDNCIEISMAE
jgi:hypothetical protein